MSLSDLIHLQIIKRIRESARLVVSLPPDLQRDARDSYDIALKHVFAMATCSTLMAYIVRLGVSFVGFRYWSVGPVYAWDRFRINHWTSLIWPLHLRKTLL
jgi:hypothetical protein